MDDKDCLPERLDPQQPPPLDRYCDLVLKGGVVDGVVYPGALLELARHYRFQSIAGTSVGAIAAAMAAACEHGRRYGSDLGFNEILRKMPQELAKQTGPTQATTLRSLFQPDVALNRLFNVVVAAMAGTGRSLFGAAWQAVKAEYAASTRKPWTLLLAAIVLLLGSWLLLAVGSGTGCFSFLHSSWLCNGCPVAPLCLLDRLARGVLLAFIWCCGVLGLLLLLVAGLIQYLRPLYAVCQDLRLLLTNPGFGFCNGLSTDGGKTQGLIDWLHSGLQKAAGLPLDQPLTFQQLWDAPGGPKDQNGQQIVRSIDLRMMTTSVSHGRPYELPLAYSKSERLYFKISELRPYFPECVISHLAAVAPRYKNIDDRLYSLDGLAAHDCLDAPHPNTVDADDFRALPIGGLPVLVAVRLSMNFPVLFKAVPLWAVDNESPREAPAVGGAPAPVFRQAWFSDGGITANFPIHFFDAPVPAWPTFGIYIAEKNRRKPDEVKPSTWLPRFHTTGRGKRWQEIRPAAPGRSWLDWLHSGFWSYLGAVKDSAIGWSDMENLRLPGIRDRVVTIFKNQAGMGGLNLNLKGEDILQLGYQTGVEAGKQLAYKFATDPHPSATGLPGTPGWLDHRWVRFNSYVQSLREHLTGFGMAVQATAHAPSIAAQIQAAKTTPPLNQERYYEPRLSARQAQALRDALTAVQDLERALAVTSITQPYQPDPAPELRVRPRL